MAQLTLDSQRFPQTPWSGLLMVQLSWNLKSLDVQPQGQLWRIKRSLVYSDPWEKLQFSGFCWWPIWCATWKTTEQKINNNPMGLCTVETNGSCWSNYLSHSRAHGKDPFWWDYSELELSFWSISLPRDPTTAFWMEHHTGCRNMSTITDCTK